MFFRGKAWPGTLLGHSVRADEKLFYHSILSQNFLRTEIVLEDLDRYHEKLLVFAMNLGRENGAKLRIERIVTPMETSTSVTRRIFLLRYAVVYLLNLLNLLLLLEDSILVFHYEVDFFDKIVNYEIRLIV